ncbi:hypothetical protein [Phenylobacterium sp.]|uniref:DUF4376 domain-containing protein n=1 Tax=Phenylobacterium sp. TaxID=1871053 RepID=UPI0035B4D378
MTQELTASREFARRTGDAWVKVAGGFEHEGFAYPPNWLDLARPSDLKRLGLKEIAPADSPPGGCEILGLEIVDDGGAPKYAYRYAPLDLAVARQRALQQLAAGRWQAEQAFVYDGVRTAAKSALADVTSLIADRRERGVDAQAITRFKLADGEFREWGEAELVAFRSVIRAYLQGLYDLEAAATARVRAAVNTPEALAVPDSIQWA